MEVLVPQGDRCGCGGCPGSPSHRAGSPRAGDPTQRSGSAGSLPRLARSCAPSLPGPSSSGSLMGRYRGVHPAGSPPAPLSPSFTHLASSSITTPPLSSLSHFGPGHISLDA